MVTFSRIFIPVAMRAAETTTIADIWRDSSVPSYLRPTEASPFLLPSLFLLFFLLVYPVNVEKSRAKRGEARRATDD